jgi:UDPglucose 6-dehydrogenase
MQIAVVGSGYVGLVAAACFAELGHQVVCVDNDPAKLAVLEGGDCPIHEDLLPELLAKHRGRHLTFSGDLRSAVRQARAIFIAVGTPPCANGEADLSYVESVAREVAEAIDGYRVVVEKSTVPVYTNEWVRKVMLLNGAQDGEFDVVSNPEFLREGTAVTDFLYPDRIVVGANRARAAEVLTELYRPLTDGSYYERKDAIPRPDQAQTPPPLLLTSAKSAELIKHASNAFLALKISFINNVATICEAVDADIREVAEGMGLDGRIGPRFLRAGIGYGGSCFPKDVAAFRSVAREYGCEFRLLDEVHHINAEQQRRFLRKVRTALWTLKGKHLGVLGLAFKGGTDDIRESPAIQIVQLLVAEGCTVTAYDPAAMARARTVLGDTVQYAAGPYEAVAGADALLLLTDWEDFAQLDLTRVRQLLHYPIVLDGRNLYPPAQMTQAGLTYYSVGRAPAHPVTEHDKSVKSKAAL